MKPSDSLAAICDTVIADYREKAETRFTHFESTTTEYFNFFINRIAPAPARVLDIGAGSGKDAAIYAEHGYDVVALEPAHELRALAAAKHTSPRITWLDGRLPLLETVQDQKQSFGHAHMNSVIFHLPLEAIRPALEATHALLKPEGTLYISLRHGPPDPARPMFPITEQDIVDNGTGLFTPILSEHKPDAIRDNVSWTRMLLRKIA